MNLENITEWKHSVTDLGEPLPEILSRRGYPTWASKGYFYREDDGQPYDVGTEDFDKPYTLPNKVEQLVLDISQLGKSHMIVLELEDEHLVIWNDESIHHNGSEVRIELDKFNLDNPVAQEMIADEILKLCNGHPYDLTNIPEFKTLRDTKRGSKKIQPNIGEQDA